jgi:Domain of unknown function (DUF6089)
MSTFALIFRNMPLKKNLQIALALLGLFSFQARSQKIEIGGGLGLMHYKGDVTPSPQLSFGRPGANLFFRYNHSSALTARANLVLGGIYGNDNETGDAFRQQRGHVFNTRISELGLQLEYNFFDFQRRRHQVDWTPYVFGGLAYMGFTPREVPEPTYRTNGLVIPFGVGLKWRVKGGWNLGLEFGTRKTFTDYLDNLGKDDPTASRFQQIDYTTVDMYYFTQLTLSYTFYRIVCPE